MSTTAIIALTAAVTAAVVFLVVAVYIRYSGRVCLHEWGAWELYGTVDLYDADFGSNMLVGKRRIMQRTCRNCGKTISRRQRI